MKNQKSILFLLLLMLTSVLSFSQTRDVGNFHAVNISSSVEVNLVESNSTSIEYTMKKGNEKDLITEVKNGVLYIKTKSRFGNWNNNTEAEVTVFYTKLDGVKTSAGCTVKSKDEIEANEIDIEVSSGSTADLFVNAKTIHVEVSSGATLNLKGEAIDSELEASSGATLNASKFITENADAEANSGASLTIHVNDTLDAEAGSGGSISYTGDVKNKNIDTGWSGSVTRKH